MYYLVDGAKTRSLKTKKKGLAEYLLQEYIKGKYGLNPTPTVKVFFDSWIQKKIEPLFRRFQVRDYNQHFKTYILPKFEETRLMAIGTGDLIDFRVDLLRKGLAVKTSRNIIDGSFRALYRDSRAEIDELKGRDPFIDVQWPATPRRKPDPFTPEERDRIIRHWIDSDFFYYPWVFTLFHTGMRPSEAAALTWNDVDLLAKTVSISKSRYMGMDSAPKTSQSARTIVASMPVVEVLRLLPSRELGLERVFVNKFGEPMNAKKWSEHNWAEPLRKIGIRHRKFYATRHTFYYRGNQAGGKSACGRSVLRDFASNDPGRLLRDLKSQPGSNRFRTASGKPLAKFGCGAGI